MFDDTSRLDLTARDIELIEAALHTQQKILSVQSEAGGQDARKRLADLKRLMKRVQHATRSEVAPKPHTWAHVAKNLFCASADCTELR